MEQQKNTLFKIIINKAGPFDAELSATSVIITFKSGEFEKALGEKPTGTITLNTAKVPRNI